MILKPFQGSVWLPGRKHACGKFKVRTIPPSPPPPRGTHPTSFFWVNSRRVFVIGVKSKIPLYVEYLVGAKVERMTQLRKSISYDSSPNCLSCVGGCLARAVLTAEGFAEIAPGFSTVAYAWRWPQFSPTLQTVHGKQGRT